MSFPLILLLTQYSAWKYIKSRLSSEKVEYEKSGWHDGDTWEKPLYWRARDLLIAQNEVKPILEKIVNAIKINSLLLLTTSISCYITFDFI